MEQSYEVPSRGEIVGWGFGVKANRCLDMHSIVCASVMLMLSSAFLIPCDSGDGPQMARALQIAGDPVAVIGWLPEVVSNGTGWYYLDGGNSSDTNVGGSIVNYTWELTVENTTSYIYAKSTVYKFRSLGLYKIELTVTDNDGNTGVSFTAVYSVPDSDGDYLPDWWEDAHFHGIQETGSGDYDHDGYTNLEEYASGKDPTVKDAQPSILTYLMDNWIYLAIAAAVIVVAFVALYPRHRRKRKREEKKKIAAAIEIEKALESEK